MLRTILSFTFFLLVHISYAQETGSLCSNGIDDDGDGLVDCADGGCSRTAYCVSESSNCADRIDNNGDGRIDCDDPACASNSICSSKETNCGDGIDNDGDGLIDCADGDCTNSASCPVESDCNNGIDDDGDGFVDYYDGDCLAEPNNPNTYIVVSPDVCSSAPINISFETKLAWDSPMQTSAAMGMPAVADLDRDGYAEIISANAETGWLYILDGRSGSVLKQVSVVAGSIHAYPAVADVDNDGYGEIFIFDTSGKLYAFEHDLTPIAAWGGSKQSVISDGRMINVADFDQDGNAELYYGNEIRDAKTGVLIVKGTHGTIANRSWDSDLAGVGVAVDMLPGNGLELVLGHIIYTVDIPGKKLTEAMSMDDAASKTLTNPLGSFNYNPTDKYRPKKAQFGTQNPSTTSVVDFNQDGNLDIILGGTLNDAITGPTMVFFWDIASNAVKAYLVTRPYEQIPPAVNSGSTFNVRANFRDVYGNSCDAADGACTWMRGLGTVSVANIDQDSDLEITFVSGSSLYALDNNFTLLWANHNAFWDIGSGYTGVTVFDFDGNGTSEILYRDEVDFYIIDGVTGQPVTGYMPGTFCSSNTQTEYPIVADVDGDGETEIIVSCSRDQNTWGQPVNTASTKSYGFIRAYKAAGDNYWVPSRSIWNQFSYFNVNINDNLSVPRYQQLHHKNFSQSCNNAGTPSFSLNKFLNQSPKLSACGQLVFSSPKLDFRGDSVRIYPPVCHEQTFQVRLYIENNGDAAVNQPIPVSFYSAHPRGTYSNAVNNPYLETIEIAVAGGLQKGQTLDTAITVTGNRGSFTLYASLNDIGPFDKNGNALSNENFYPLNSINGPVRECDTLSTVIAKPVSPPPFAIKTVVISDNNKCASTVNGQPVPDNGLIEVYQADSSKFPVSDYKFLWTNVATGQTIAPATQDYAAALPAGTYRVEVVYDNGVYTCPGMADTVTVKLIDEFPADERAEIRLIQEVSGCKPGTADGSAYVTINGVAISDADYLIRWEDEEKPGVTLAVGDTITGMSQLSYKASITNRLTGCQTSATFDMTLPTPALAEPVVTDNTDCTNPNGAVTATLQSGNTSGYQYELIRQSPVQDTLRNDNGQFTNLDEGVYALKAYHPVTKCGLYSSGVSVEIKNIYAPVILLDSLTDVRCSGGNDGSIYTTVTGNSTYTYAWYRDSTSWPVYEKNITGLPAGTYQLHVTDQASDCLFLSEEFIIEDGIAPVSQFINAEAVAIQTDGFTLTWDRVYNATYYYVTLDDAANFSSVNAADTVVDTRYTFSGLLPATTYYVKVQAHNFCNSSTDTIISVKTVDPLVTDSLALVALYHATGGDNWTRKDNWLTGPLNTWYGVNLDKKRVYSLNLFNNNLTGELPVAINHLNYLNYFDFSGNNIDALPDSLFANSKVVGYLYDNRLTFKDILRHPEYLTKSGDQQAIGKDTTVYLYEGDLYTIYLAIDSLITDNTYVWIKDDVAFDTTHLNRYQLNNLSPDDAGIYTCQVTNPRDFRNLTLYSHPTTIHIIKDQVLQTIAFDSIADKTYGDTAFLLAATASSGLPVRFEIIEGQDRVNLADNQLSIQKTGKVTVRASQAGNEDFAPASVVDRTFTIQQAQQLVVFDSIADKHYGDAPFAVSARATSHLPIWFNMLKGSDIITLEDSLITISKPGTVTVRASQLGNENYKPAQAERSFTVHKAPQTIALDAIADQTIEATSVTLQATSSAALAVDFTTTGPVAVSGSTLTLLDTGLVTVTATQAGNDYYLPATAVSQSFRVVATEKPAEPDSIQVYQMSVQVTTANRLPVPALTATLYQKEGSRFVVVAEKAFSNTSSLPFDNLLPGNYTVRIKPDDGAFLPAYLGNRLTLAEAQITTLSQDTAQSVMLLSTPDASVEGNIAVSGILLSDPAAGNGKILKSKSTAEGTPLQHIAVYLLDADSKKVVAYAVTNQEGKFDFAGLPEGHYLFVADYEGLPQDESQNAVSIASHHAGVFLTAVASDRIWITATEVVNQVTGTEKEVYQNPVLYYPNPVLHELWIEVDPVWLNGTIQVSDLSGKLLKTEKVRHSKMKLNLEGFKTGVYHITISKNNVYRSFKISKQ